MKDVTKKVGKSVYSKKNFAYVTQQGLIDSKAELEHLKKEKRAEVSLRIEAAIEFGKTDENSEYEAALDEQALVENRITYLEDLLRDAKVISKQPQGEFVVIGSTVKVEMGGGVDEFTIVGKLEANPAKKKISNESPVGSALLGAKLGEEVEVATPIVRYTCKVLEIK